MGLTSKADPKRNRPLDFCLCPNLIHEILERIVRTMGDSNHLKDKYGCRSLGSLNVDELAIGALQRSMLQQLDASFDNFKIESVRRIRQTPLAKKTCWVVHDRKKFESLIFETKGLVDGL